DLGPGTDIFSAAGGGRGQARTHLRHVAASQSGGNHHKLVAAHAADVVIQTASAAQPDGEGLQQLVAGDVPVAVVDLLESVEIAEDHPQPRALASATRDLRIQVLKQRARVGQPGEIVDASPVGGVLILGGVLDGGGDVVADGKQDAQVVGGKRVGLLLVER